MGEGRIVRPGDTRWPDSHRPFYWRREQDDVYDGSVTGLAPGAWRTALTGATFALYEKSHVRIYGQAIIKAETNANVWSRELLRFTLNGVAPVAPQYAFGRLYANITDERRNVSLHFQYTWKDQAGAVGGTAYVPVLEVNPFAAGGTVMATDPYMEIDLCRAGS